MIFHEERKFLNFFQELNPTDFANRSTMKQALLLSPEHFSISSQSATDNQYMDTSRVVDSVRAAEQHLKLQEKIDSLGVPVQVFAGLPGMDEAVFLNNAFATIPSRLIVGRMLHPVRQRETNRADIRQWFKESLNYEMIDLNDAKWSTAAAELTGVLVLDRLRDVGFCGMSSRVDAAGAKEMYDAFKLKALYLFPLHESEYHTNVVMTILAGKAAIIYKQGLKLPAASECIARCYKENLIVISEDEKNSFVANSLAITPNDVLFSKTAYRAMSTETRDGLERAGLKPHFVDVSEFEKAGGSLRCLIAEIF